MQNYGQAIAGLRKKHGMTQTQLGDKLNVTCQAVSKWENNLSQPDIDTVREMLSLFGVTMEQFVAIASGEQVDDEPDDESPFAARASENKFAGTCTECGLAVYESDVGVLTPKLLCKKCLEKKTAAEKAKAEYADARTLIMKGTERHKFRLSFFVAALVAAVVGTAAGFYKVWLAFPAAIAVFTFVAQLFWDNVVADIAEGGFGRGIRLPGIIFSFDLDGLKFLILMKFLFAALSMVVSVLFVIGAVSVAIVVSLFTFIPSLIGRNREIENMKWTEPPKTYQTRTGTHERPDIDYAAELAALKTTDNYIKYVKNNKSEEETENEQTL